MKYNRPHVHIYTDSNKNEHSVSILVPLENDHDVVSFNDTITGSGVEIAISIGDILTPNIHVEKFGPKIYSFEDMSALLVEVRDKNDDVIGVFKTDNPEEEGDPESTDEVSHFVYLNQPDENSDYQLHVLVDISESFRNKDTQNKSLKDEGDGVYVLEIEQVNESRNGLPIEGSISFGGSHSTIHVDSQDVSNQRKRGPKKLKPVNRDVRS